MIVAGVDLSPCRGADELELLWCRREEDVTVDKDAALLVNDSHACRPRLADILVSEPQRILTRYARRYAEHCLRLVLCPQSSDRSVACRRECLVVSWKEILWETLHLISVYGVPEIITLGPQRSDRCCLGCSLGQYLPHSDGRNDGLTGLCLWERDAQMAILGLGDDSLLQCSGISSLSPYIEVGNAHRTIYCDREETLSLTVSLHASTYTEPWLSEIHLNGILSVRQREIECQPMAAISEGLEELPVTCAVDRDGD